jgi:hypothetical protein
MAHEMAPKIHLVHAWNWLKLFTLFLLKIPKTVFPDLGRQYEQVRQVNPLRPIVAILCRAFESQVLVFHVLVKLVSAREAVFVAVKIAVGAAMWASIQVRCLEMKL